MLLAQVMVSLLLASVEGGADDALLLVWGGMAEEYDGYLGRGLGPTGNIGIIPSCGRWVDLAGGLFVGGTDDAGIVGVVASDNVLGEEVEFHGVRGWRLGTSFT